MRISKFATDTGLEEDGVWIDIGEGASLKVARIGNPRYRKALRAATKPHARSIRMGILPQDQIEELELNVIADTILLDWKGIEDDNGDPIEYNRENALQLLQNLRDFRALVLDIAQEQQAFRREEQEESGNS